LKTSRIIVTGAAGFIGSHVTEALVRRGSDVLGIDNFDPFYDRAKKLANVDSIEAVAAGSGGSFRLVDADVSEPGAFAIVAEPFAPDAVLHLAAKAGVRPSIDDPPGYARANVAATSEVLDASARLGCGRVVVASSSSVYGNCPTVPFAEDADTNRPISPYAATKRACELLAHTHHHLTGQPVCCLRFFTVYGPRQRPDLAIAKFMRAIDAGETITMYGNGTTSRDYTYIDDIVAGVLAALERTPEFGYRVWNLGSDRPTRLDELIAAIGEVVGKAPDVRRGEPQAGDVERTWADLTRSRAELGYAPGTDLRTGLTEQWAASHR
jgi:UDP-glucuronate 4-epimerase